MEDNSVIMTDIYEKAEKDIEALYREKTKLYNVLYTMCIIDVRKELVRPFVVDLYEWLMQRHKKTLERSVGVFDAGLYTLTEIVWRCHGKEVWLNESTGYFNRIFRPTWEEVVNTNFVKKIQGVIT